jgi:hypothetical protein
MTRIFLVSTLTAIYLNVFNIIFLYAFYLLHPPRPLLVTLMPVLSIAIVICSSLETSLAIFIGIFNLFILLLIVVKSRADGTTFP